MSAALPEGALCSKHPDIVATAVCARCGDFLCTGCAIPIDGAVYCGKCEAFGGEPFPWERRRELGIARAALETMQASITEPQAFARGFRDRSILPALSYAAALTTLFSVVTGAIVLWPAPDLSMPVGDSGNPVEAFFASDLGTVVVISCTPITTIVGACLLAFGWWLGLIAFGAASRPLDQVVRTVAYVQGSLAPLALLALAPPELATPSNLIHFAAATFLCGRALQALMRSTGPKMVGAGAVALVTVLAVLFAVALVVVLAFMDVS